MKSLMTFNADRSNVKTMFFRISKIVTVFRRRITTTITAISFRWMCQLASFNGTSDSFIRFYFVRKSQIISRISFVMGLLAFFALSIFFKGSFSKLGLPVLMPICFMFAGLIVFSHIKTNIFFTLFVHTYILTKLKGFVK